MKASPGATPPHVLLEMLQQNRLFQGVSPQALAGLAQELEPVLAQPGEWIMREGDSADVLFVILNGELEVLSHASNTHNEVRVALLGPGDWVGEMAVLDEHPERTASVRSLAPSLLARLTVAHMNQLRARELGIYASVMHNIARELGRRLLVADHLIARTGSSVAKQYVLESMRPSIVPDR
jgi:CRP/FNR family cyclic AMP-dependent transcriptional regulator